LADPKAKTVQRTNEVGVSLRFQVEIDGMIAAGFSEVKGLQSETEVKPHWEGGLNTHPHHWIEHTKYPNLVMTRGITMSSELWSWYADVVAGTIKRKNGAIILNNFAGKEVCRWNFYDAFPVKWSGPDLSGMSSNIAVETIELVHGGLKAVFKK